MPLTAGTRLGPYEILSPLGAGGMGEVYRARDGQLGRDVAIKVLPEAVASDAERLARFQREAQILAALNHPHIAAIYGLEKSGAAPALVLELVEGETLADRLAAGPIPLDESLSIARQIADALEAAHERGIVHRDLKPANVKRTPGGQIKVLDFGLAKAVSDGSGSAPDATSSPTLTARSTETGIVLGSAAYMSPEQARGRPVDKRADVWAFGALLFEMLSGQRAFGGETVSDTLAAVLMADPDWSALPPETPANVRRMLRRCLERDRNRRLHDIADARLELEELSEPLPRAGSAAASTPARSRTGLFQGVAALLALVAGLGWWMALRKSSGPAPRSGPTALAVALADSEQIPFDDSPVLDLSRDGRHLVFASERDGIRRLMVRSLDSGEARPLPGTERAFSPFFSPDAQWIGFFADAKLKKIPAAGGAPFVLADAPNNRGGVWLTDDSIVYAPDFSSGLMRIPAAGGSPEVLTSPDAKAGERTHRWPAWLPGDGSVLFTVGTLKNPGSYDDGRIAILDAKSRKTRVVLSGGSMARWAPSGHLVYVRSELLMAAPFDERRREVVGDAVALPDRAAGDPSSGVVYSAVGGDGTFAFVPGRDAATAGSGLVLTDRSGKPTVLPVPPRPYHYPRFSPDGKQLAVTIGLGHGNRDEVWICDVATGALRRLTFGDENGNFSEVWSPDGRRLAYSSDRQHQGIFWKSSDGTGNEEPLEPSALPDLPADWSRDGTTLAITKNFPTTDVWTVSVADRKQTLIEKSAAAPVFSPDGRWLAYCVLPSSDSPPQVLVRPLAGGGGKIQITSDQGLFPVWTDKELIFMADKKVVAIETQTSPTFHAGARRELFETPYDRGSIPLRNYDVTRDGQTFVWVRDASDRARKRIDVVLDWSSGLPRAAPSRK